MRPFGCLVTILNTIDHLGKFDEKADEGFFIRYSTNSKAFRVFNSRTRIVEENLLVQFRNQSNCNADPPFSSSPKDSLNARFKPLEDEEKKDAEDPGNEEADMTKLDTHIHVSPIPTTKIHKDYPLNQVIGDLESATQTRQMTKNLEEYGRTQKGSSSNKGSKLDKGYAGRASTIQAIRSLDFARLVAQGYTQEKGIDYDEVFAPIARIEAIRIFLAYALFKDFVVYQMDVKSTFLYGKIEEEVYVCQPPGFEDPDFPNRVYKVEKALYGLNQAPRAWYEALSTYLLENEF
ncbi:retrovirus-related pol polyprotein from transposon TNT 1-94 [Tanacetum coccineum]